MLDFYVTVLYKCSLLQEPVKLLFVLSQNELILSKLLHVYLLSMNLQIVEDGKLPKKICQSCNQSVNDITSYFNLLVSGQQRLRELWKEQVTICI